MANVGEQAAAVLQGHSDDPARLNEQPGKQSKSAAGGVSGGESSAGSRAAHPAREQRGCGSGGRGRGRPLPPTHREAHHTELAQGLGRRQQQEGDGTSATAQTSTQVDDDAVSQSAASDGTSGTGSVGPPQGWEERRSERTLALYTTIAAVPQEVEKKSDRYLQDCLSDTRYRKNVLKHMIFFPKVTKKLAKRCAEPGGATAQQEDEYDMLAEFAEKENWGSSSENRESVPILRSYVMYYFAWQLENGNVYRVHDRKDNAILGLVFNTGLLSRTVAKSDLYCVAVPSTGPHTWIFKLWDDCGNKRENGRKKPTLVSDVPTASRPPPANFMSEPERLFLNTRVLKGTDDLIEDSGITHIVEHNFRRFPDNIQRMKDTQIAKAALRQAIADAITHAKRDYKVAVPHVYGDQVQLMLPLYLEEKSTLPDLALALRAQVSDACDECHHKAVERYTVPTALTLSMAYNNARLITRPRSEWLSPAAEHASFDD